MKLKSTNNRVIPQSESPTIQFVVWNVFKMLLVAIACGLAVSMLAAGIALILAGDASAAPSAERFNENGTVDAATAETIAPTPGRLLIGIGCDAEPLDALERDWHVTINGNNIDVRVMQSFVIPDGDLPVVTFNAQLPGGARLTRLAAHTAGGVWQGRIYDAVAYDRLTAPEFRSHSRRSILIVQNDDGAISTDAVINLAAAETVTIEYTYRINADEAQGVQNLLVMLGDSVDSAHSIDGSARRVPTRGAVWVEWIGAQPAQLLNLPHGASVEKSGAQISGLSWSTLQADRDARFQLAWVR